MSTTDLLLDWESASGEADELEDTIVDRSKYSTGVGAVNLGSSTDGGGGGSEQRIELNQYIAEFDERQTKKMELRRQNSESTKQRPDESFFTKLDSNLKKNTNFVRKLKTFSESQKDSIVKDFKTLNLTKYVAEIAVNLCEAKLKMSDVPSMAEFCSLMNQRYVEFGPNFMETFKKSFPSSTSIKQKITAAADDKSTPLSNPSKFRVDLRLLAELIVVGVATPEKDALNVLGSTLKYLCSNPGNDFRHLPLVITFMKFCGDDYAGTVPRRVRMQCEQFQLLPADRLRSRLMGADRQKTVRNLFMGYYQELADKYVAKLFRELKHIERQNRRQYETKGEIHPEAQQRLDEAKSAFEKLQQNVLQLADFLDMDAPVLPEVPEESDTETSGNLIVSGGIFERIEGGAGGLWEDEDTRMFYETLPELRAMLPGILFKESEQATLAPVEEKIDEVTAEDEVTGQSETGEQQQSESTTGGGGGGPPPQEPMEDTPEPEDPAKAADLPDEDEDAEASSAGGGGGVSNSTLKQMMDGFVAQLPNTINRDLIDRAATDFVTNLNTKPNRKRLVKALFSVPRIRQDLLPFYSRLVAILRPVMPDVSTELVRLLINDFRFQIKKKEQLYVESKVRVVRFIGELVKFKVFPKSEALHCLKTLLYDFRHHNIDMACGLLDTCGRFLYFSPDSHQKTKILLEQMERKTKAAAYLDQRYHLMVENALATCKPDIAVAQKEKIERLPWQEFMRKLVFKDLNGSSVDKVLKQMRKFNWDDSSVSTYAITCLSQPWHVRFSCVQWLASLVAGLMYYYDYVGYQVIDNIMEELRLGLEINHNKFNQRRLCSSKYLAEMYNFRVIDSPLIFNTMYSLITYGISYDPAVPSPLDPPEHLFRIRLACTVLETCGEYFDRGMTKKKLDCYLTYLQRYYWTKKRAPCWNDDELPFPGEVVNMLKDTADFLRPKLKLFANLEEAEAAVKLIEDEYREKAESALKFVQPTDEQQRQAGGGDEEWEEEGDAPLRTITEEDDEDGGGMQGRHRVHQSQDSAGASQNQGAQGSQGGGPDWRGQSGDRDSDDDRGVNRGAGDEDDEEFRVIRTGTTALVADPEDEEFTAAFDRLMAESVQQRMQETAKPGAVEIPLPPNVKTKLAARAHFDDEGEQPSMTDVKPKESEFVNFGLLVKGRAIGGGGGGAKQAVKTIKVAVDSELACLLRDREKEAEMEKQRVKQLTLNISRRMQQEEELAEMADLQKKVRENLAPQPYAKLQQPQQQQQQQQRGAGGNSSGWQHQRGAPGPQEAFAKNWQRR